MPAVIGRSREYSSEASLPVLKPIWFAAYQPCGKRLQALLPEWLPAYEQDHRRINSDVRQALLSASARTLDRMLATAFLLVVLKIFLDNKTASKI
jgi:hypothetical protein